MYLPWQPRDESQRRSGQQGRCDVQRQQHELGWAPIEDPVHVNDFHATVMHLFGMDHLRFTVKSKGLRVRLTNQGGKLVKKLLA